MTHALKTWPEYYQAVEDGIKQFELRKAHRPFRVGDHLLLQEYDPKAEQYTGRFCTRAVMYRLDGPCFGLDAGFCILSIGEGEAIK